MNQILHSADPMAAELLAALSIPDSPRADVVAVAGPLAARHDLIHKFLVDNKHVLVFGLPCGPLHQRLALEMIAAGNHRRLAAFPLSLFTAPIPQLHQLVAQGKLVGLRLLQLECFGEKKPLWDVFAEELPGLLSLAGTEILQISALTDDPHQPRLLNLRLAFKGGEIKIVISSLPQPQSRRLLAIADQSVAEWDGESLSLQDERIPAKPNVRDAAAAAVAAFQGGDPGQDAMAHMLLQAAQQAAKSGMEEDCANAKWAAADVMLHPTAIVDAGVTIGSRSRIWHFSHILSGVRIGSNVNIGQNVVIGPDVVVGDNCKIQNNVSLYKGVTLEQNVFCGPSCVFTNVNNPRATIERKSEYRTTLVKNGATIGANATIVCGHTLGSYSFIAAGAVVTRDVPDFALMAGNPARRIGWMSHAGNRLGTDLVCPTEGRRYRETAAGILQEIVK